MKITKSELKEMIRQILHEELKAARVLHESAKATTCYICGKPADDSNATSTIFGFVHDTTNDDLSCWESFMESFEYGANYVYEIAREGSLAGTDLDYNDDDDYDELYEYLDGWDACQDEGILPFSEAECASIRDRFFMAIKK